MIAVSAPVPTSAHPRWSGYAICAATRLTRRDLASRVPTLHQDWPHAFPLCTGTGLTRAHICTGTGLPVASVQIDQYVSHWLAMADVDPAEEERKRLVVVHYMLHRTFIIAAC